MIVDLDLSPAYRGTLAATDQAIERLLGHLTPPGMTDPPPAGARIQAHYAQARGAMKAALLFAQWLEQRALASDQARRDAQAVHGDFFDALFGQRAASPLPADPGAVDTGPISSTVNTVTTLAESILQIAIEAEGAVLAMIALRDAPRLLELVDILCHNLDAYGAAAAAQAVGTTSCVG